MCACANACRILKKGQAGDFDDAAFIGRPVAISAVALQVAATALSAADIQLNSADRKRRTE